MPEWLGTHELKAGGYFTRDVYNKFQELRGDRYQISKPKVVPEIEKAIKDWKNPGSRRADRFYCGKCTEPLRCGVALFQHVSIGEQGHTAWAYAIPKVWQEETLYNFPNEDGQPSGAWRV